MAQPAGNSSVSTTDPPTIPIPRPVLRGRLHALAAAVSVGALAWLVHSAASVEATVAAWIYGVAAILCYLTSSIYHVVARSDRARAFMRRADHSMIYVLIAGTFTPMCLLGMTGSIRWVYVGVVWAGALLGVGLSIVPSTPLPRFSVALYLILGWAGVAVLPALARNPMRIVLVLVAGVLYTVGAVLFGRQRPRLRPSYFGFHEFWHCMGVSAGALLFVVNLSLITTRT
jgi:hemolysin III